MVTYNEKHHWVFPLVATACAYAKLGEYLGKLQKSQILALGAHGDFGDHLEVRQMTQSKSQGLESKMRKSKTIIFDTKETIQNTFARIVNVPSGSGMGKIPVGKLMDVERLYHLEDEAGITQNELADLANREIVGNLGGEEKIVQLQEEKEKG